MALVGLLVVGLVGLIAFRDSGNTSVPEDLAFADADDAVGHSGHDHSSIISVPHDHEDYVVLGLGGEVPSIIGENFAMPPGSEVIHVVTHDGDIWEFEGRLPNGASFWKVIDLQAGLIYDAGQEAGAAAFP